MGWEGKWEGKQRKRGVGLCPFAKIPAGTHGPIIKVVKALVPRNDSPGTSFFGGTEQDCGMGLEVMNVN